MKSRNIFYQISEGNPFHIDFRTFIQFDQKNQNVLKEKLATQASHETVARIFRTVHNGAIEIWFFDPASVRIMGVGSQSQDLTNILPSFKLLNPQVFLNGQPCSDEDIDEANEVCSQSIEIVNPFGEISEILIFSLWLEPETFKAVVGYRTDDGQTIGIRFMDWAEYEVLE